MGMLGAVLAPLKVSRPHSRLTANILVWLNVESSLKVLMRRKVTIHGETRVTISSF